MGDTPKWQSFQCTQPCKTCSVLWGCTKAGRWEQPSDAQESLPTRRPRDSTVLLLLPMARGEGGILLNHKNCPHRDNSLKKRHYFVSAVKSWSLCTISFHVHRRAKIAMLIMLLVTNKIDALTILQCFRFIEQNTIWKWYLPSQIFCSTWKINQYKANQHYIEEVCPKPQQNLTNFCCPAIILWSSLH